MSLIDSNNGMYMPVAPAYGNNGGYGYGAEGGLFWIIILFLFAAMNGNWGNNGGGSSQIEIQRVVDQQSVMNGQQNILQTLNQIAMAQQNCCCENRAAVADLKYTMAQESAATRSNTDAKVQAVMDKLCQLELDSIKQNYENRIASMQNQIDALRLANSDARFDASQNTQTATIQTGQRNLASEVEQYILPTARPAYIVQNPNGCPTQTFGCGCAAAV